MKRLKFFITSFGLLAFVMSSAPALVSAAPAPTAPTSAQTACQAVTGKADCTDSSGGPSVNKLVSVVVSLLSIIIGIIAVIMIIVGGLRYVTSNGDANAISGAKNTILYAIIGLVVAGLAQGLVQFVLKNVT